MNWVHGVVQILLGKGGFLYEQDSARGSVSEIIVRQSVGQVEESAQTKIEKRKRLRLEAAEKKH